MKNEVFFKKNDIAAYYYPTVLYFLRLFLPVWILLTDDVYDVPLGKGQPRLLARDVLVVHGVVVEERAQPDAGLAEHGTVLVRNQLERDGVLRALLKITRLLSLLLLCVCVFYSLKNSFT